MMHVAASYYCNEMLLSVFSCAFTAKFEDCDDSLISVRMAHRRVYGLLGLQTILSDLVSRFPCIVYSRSK